MESLPGGFGVGWEGKVWGIMAMLNCEVMKDGICRYQRALVCISLMVLLSQLIKYPYVESKTPIVVQTVSVCCFAWSVWSVSLRRLLLPERTCF